MSFDGKRVLVTGSVFAIDGGRTAGGAKRQSDAAEES